MADAFERNMKREHTLIVHRDGVNLAGQIKVKPAYPLYIMDHQVYLHRSVRVGPLWVVFHLFSDQGNLSHEAERLDEIGELVFSVEVPHLETPSGQRLEP